MKWWSVCVGITLLIGGLSLLILQSTSLMSIDNNLSVDVYFSSDSCMHTTEFSEELSTDPKHFLLVSNCVGSKSFRDAGTIWRFEYLLPSFVYQQNNGGLGRFLQQWLQQSSGRIEHLPPEQFEGTSFLSQIEERRQIESLHFLCAYPELLAQYPKSQPRTLWEKNQYALLAQCLGDKQYPHQNVIPKNYIEGSNADGLGSLFVEGTASMLDFDTWIQSTIQTGQK